MNPSTCKRTGRAILIHRTDSPEPPIHVNPPSPVSPTLSPSRPTRTPRRRIRDPDSDSESDINAGADASLSPPRAAFPPITPRRTPLRPTSRSTRAQVRKYLDIYASGPSRRGVDNDDSEDEEKRAKESKWREKYYDDSLGSLEDFIVPDDYESEASSSASEGASEEEDGDVVHSGGEDDDEDIIPLDSPVKKPPAENGHMLHFSPPPRLLTLPDIGGLVLDESDEEDDITPEPPRAPPKTPTSRSRTNRPAPKAKTPSKKAWATERVRLAQDIFDELDRKVFERKLGPQGAGATLEWNNRMLTTAGTANSKW